MDPNESKRNINISGKKNIYGLMKMEDTTSATSELDVKYYGKRAACEKWNLPDH